MRACVAYLSKVKSDKRTYYANHLRRFEMKEEFFPDHFILLLKLLNEPEVGHGPADSDVPYIPSAIKSFT